MNDVANPESATADDADRRPVESVTDARRKKRFLVRITGVAIGGMFIDGYVIGILAPVMTDVTTSLGMSLAWSGLIGAAALIGIFIGGLVGGTLADKLGRIPLFTVDLMIFIAASVCVFFVQEGWQLVALRLVAGIAIGADYAIASPLLAEFAPRRLRGKLLSLCTVAWYVGFLAAFVVGHVLTTTFAVDWRLVLATSLVPSVILLVARIGMPESPRWLMTKGRTEEANKIAYAYMEDPADVFTAPAASTQKTSFRTLFSPGYRRATIFVCVFWCCSATPYYAIATFSTSVLDQYGLSDGLMGAIGVSGLALVGVVVATLAIERVGRRKLTIPPMWVTAVVLIAIAVWTSAPSMVVLVGFLIFAFFNAICVCLTGVYPGEVYPTEIRGLGTGFGTAMSRIAAGLGTFAMPWSMDTIGISGTLLFAAAICVVGAVVSQLLAPETTGLDLSATSAPRDSALR